MCRNVHRMVVISAYNAIDPLDIVGACMRTRAKIYRAHRSKMADRTVQ